MPLFKSVKNPDDEHTKIAARVAAEKLGGAHADLKKALVALSSKGLLNLGDTQYCAQLALIHDVKRFSKDFTDEETRALDKFLEGHRDKISKVIEPKSQETLLGDLSFLDDLDEQVAASTASDNDSPGRTSPVSSAKDGQKFADAVVGPTPKFLN